MVECDADADADADDARRSHAHAPVEYAARPAPTAEHAAMGANAGKFLLTRNSALLADMMSD